MKIGLLWPVTLGLAALGVIITAAFVPWSEWLAWDRIETKVAGVFGPPRFDRFDSAPFRTVEISASGQKTVDVWVYTYLGTLLLAFGLWIVLVGTFFRHLGRLKAILGTVCAGIVVLVCILVILGTRSLGFIARKFAVLTSTWIVKFGLQRLCLQGPFLLLVGIVLEVSAAIWAVRVKRRC
jgi:hypothetical protein